MKLVVDIQGAQSASRHRGIGRHSLAFTEALARRMSQHELWLAVNGALPEAIDALRQTFAQILPKERVVLWRGMQNVAGIEPLNEWRRNSAELIREAFLANLRPDIVHVTSLFEGVVDDAAISIGRLTKVPTSVTLYDLIPLVSPERYLINPAVNAHYQRGITSVRRADLWLAISNAARDESINLLNLPSDRVINISSAADARFRPLDMSPDEVAKLRSRYNLQRPFVMYTGAISSSDPRKNLDRLLGAFASLDPAVRKQHQLLVVAPAQDSEIQELRASASKRGCGEREVVIAPHVPDADLVALYNTCKAFCFPSLHEGFGLPALEAMQCGAAVIGSNIPSVAEVIGLGAALFDPKSEADIGRLLNRVLTDADFHAQLVDHGKTRSKSFSWDETARRAVEGFEELHARRQRPQPTSTSRRGLPRLAFVSPLPPQESGISDYSLDLLPELARHYEIDVVVDQPTIDSPWVEANCQKRDVSWFEQNAGAYDRILYQFGNSPFHSHMFDLLPMHPGVVVLHDFFLSAVVSHLELHEGRRGFWTGSLYESHGYTAVVDWVRNRDVQAARYKYPTNFSVLAHASGVIVHSKFSQELARKTYGQGVAEDWAVVPQLRSLAAQVDRSAARERLGIAADDFVVCSFGHMDSTKLNVELIDAWALSRLGVDSKAKLFFVGGRHGGAYGASVDDKIRSRSELRERIAISGFVSQEVYADYLQAADVAVQLRTNSRGETSRAVLDCLAYGVPTITNAHGPMAELPAHVLATIADQFTSSELAHQLDLLRDDRVLRETYTKEGRAYVMQDLNPRIIAEQYHEAIEGFSSTSVQALRAQTVAATGHSRGLATYEDFAAFARALSADLPLARPSRRLFVDVSANASTTLKSGIERVVSRQARELLSNPPEGFRVEPVRLVNHDGHWRYMYARAYTTQLLDLGDGLPDDEVIEVIAGDVFYSADYSPENVTSASRQGLYAGWRRAGVQISFNVYDLLPVTNPEWFPEFSRDIHANWLAAISADADQLICISGDVAESLRGWLSNRQTNNLPSVSSVHLGADFAEPVKRQKDSSDEGVLLPALSSAPTFLMVGTLEPRKGYLQAIQAFEQLWSEGVNVNLVIVGAEGWRPLPHEQRRTIPQIVKLIQQSRELGKHLFWLESLKDSALDEMYKRATCLLAASEGEGFGLPLIEAAQHGLPILARDIPVFREVAGPHASYFHASKFSELATGLKKWLSGHRDGKHTLPGAMPWLTWTQSVNALKATLLKPSTPEVDRFL